MKYDSNDPAKLPDDDIHSALADEWGEVDGGYSHDCVNSYRLGAASWDDQLNEQDAEIARLRAELAEAREDLIEVMATGPAARERAEAAEARAGRLARACANAKRLYDHLALGTLEAAARYGDSYEPPSDADCLRVRAELETALADAPKPTAPAPASELKYSPYGWIYHPDPSGNNDAHWTCCYCGIVVSRRPESRHECETKPTPASEPTPEIPEAVWEAVAKVRGGVGWSFERECITAAIAAYRQSLREGPTGLTTSELVAVYHEGYKRNSLSDDSHVASVDAGLRAVQAAVRERLLGEEK